jgi:hypothetical protein
VEEGDSYIPVYQGWAEEIRYINKDLLSREIPRDSIYKRDKRLRHLYITAIRFLADELYDRIVRHLYIGYPYMLSQNNGNEYNTKTYGGSGR